MFGAALLLSFAQPARIETFAREMLRREIEVRVGEALSQAERSAVGQFAQRLAQRYPEQAAAVTQQMRERIAPLIEAVMVEMRDPHCPCRQKLAQMIDATLPPGRLADLLQPGERLIGFVRAKYAETSAALLREFRIFTGANALMFALLGVVLFVRRGARASLLLPAGVLLATTLAVACLYLFGQNWLHTIVFGDYAGWSYVVELALVGGLLADIALNRARVCRRLLATVGAAGASVC